MFGLWGLGSLIGGAVASRLSAGPDPGRRVIVLLAALAGSTLPLVLAAGVVSLGALIFLAGIAIAPALAAVHSLAGRLAVRGTITEAYTWLGTGMGAGIAAGAAIGGAVVEGSGTQTAFAFSAAALAMAAAAGAHAAGQPPRRLTRQTRAPPNADFTGMRCLMGVLDDKVAIVTGSARGIGRATAELLSEQGAKVLINDLDGDAAEQTAGEIARRDGRLRGRPDQGGRRRTRSSRRRSTPGASSTSSSTTPATRSTRRSTRCPTTAFQRMLDIHTIVPFRVLRAAAPHLREPAKAEREQGDEVFRKVVNVSSISGTMGNAGQANYAAGKAGVVGLTKTLAKEWGQFKINVNAVAFGYIETRLTASKDDDNVMEIDGEKVQLGIPDQLRGMAAMLIPLGRPGSPEEAAGGVFFLCSPWSQLRPRPGAERHRRPVHRA